MTTVAYRDGIMASDSCWSTGSIVDSLACKVERLKSGALLGQSGDNDIREIIALLENVKTAKAMPTYSQLAAIRVDCTLLLVLPKGAIFKISTSKKLTQDDEDDLGVWRVERPLAAIGSGSDLALGAMAHGASAVQAVRIACRWDINSRPPVHQLTLKVT